jgi:hypothetical protein
VKIEGTELEYNEAEGICLDYCLGGLQETKEQFAKRIWDNCKRFEQGLETEPYNDRIYKKYSYGAALLWEEKKRRCRVSLVRDKKNMYPDMRLCTFGSVKEDIKKKRPCNWPDSHLDSEILLLKNDSKYGYQTATERHLFQEAEFVEEQKKTLEERAEKVATLRTKFDDETIAIIFPEGAGLL